MQRRRAASTERGSAGSGGTDAGTWDSVRERLRDRGLRWTPQRRLLVGILANTDGHVTGAELVERCRQADAATIPSTVYRTLDVLEELGLLQHCHGVDGREEFHVLPETEHGHLFCERCRRSWEIEPREAGGLMRSLNRRYGFQTDLSHLTVVGRCRACSAAR